MTDTSMREPGTEEPLILESLTDLEEQENYLAHYPDIRGRAVINPKGDKVGVVDDLYVNPRDRQVEMAAISFSDIGEYGGKRVLVPVEEIEILDHQVRIMTRAEHVRLAPEFHEGAPMYEPYYEYWSNQPAGPIEKPSKVSARPSGRLELEGEEIEEE